MKFVKLWNCFFPLLIICLFIISSPAKSQFDNEYKIALGLSTVKFIGDNPGALRIFPAQDVKEIYGGSFDQMQPGIELRLTMPIGDSQDFRIPIGLDYQFYSAREVAANYSYYETLHHSLDVLSFYFGLQWAFVKFPLANAVGYIGLEARASYLNGISLEYEKVWRNPKTPAEYYEFTLKERGKNNTLRLGGTFRIGIEGDLDDRFQINPSVAFSVMNLLFRNKDRGELLTSFNLFDTRESYVFNYHISILIQYKL